MQRSGFLNHGHLGWIILLAGAVLCPVGCLHASSNPHPKWCLYLWIQLTKLIWSHLQRPMVTVHWFTMLSPQCPTFRLVPKFTFAAPLPERSFSQICTWPPPSHQPGLNSSLPLLRKTFPTILPKQPTLCLPTYPLFSTIAQFYFLHSTN